jgi:hypothetical protein
MDDAHERPRWTLILADHSGPLAPDEVAQLLALIQKLEAERQAPDAPDATAYKPY